LGAALIFDFFAALFVAALIFLAAFALGTIQQGECDITTANITNNTWLNPAVLGMYVVGWIFAVLGAVFAILMTFF